jgi:hypothetical protein
MVDIYINIGIYEVDIFLCQHPLTTHPSNTHSPPYIFELDLIVSILALFFLKKKTLIYFSQIRTHLFFLIEILVTV